MEDTLADQAEQNVQRVLNPDHSIEDLLHSLDNFRQVTQACIFADFNNAEKRGARLWQAHTESRKYIHRVLSGFRKQRNKPVETRHLSKLFLRFVKDAQVSYREYILKLSTNFGGIPELQAVAQQVKNDAVSESSLQSVSPELRAKVLAECHQTLIYLGDLSRYRASEKVDKTPDFGPAIGYYELACTLKPQSGMGHHQQAVVALEQRNHLRAIYHLYCAIVVDDPHPNAAHNLKLEFDKTNAAWDRGELIQKGPPNDPDASKKVLLGWFVRFQSLSFRGEHFNGFEELEREVLGKFNAEIQKNRLEASFMRMIKTNLAAQFYLGEKFQHDQAMNSQMAFLYLFRFNIKTFTVLLTIFYENTRLAAINIPVEDPEDLAKRLDQTSRRTLPALRLYSSWLLPMVTLLTGLSSDPFVSQAVEQMWSIYAKTIDLTAQAFPIWDLEELPQVNYLLDEDLSTLGFKPLINKKTNKVWYDKQTGLLKPRFSDACVRRVSVDDEMMSRVKDFLADGLYLANDDDSTPIKICGTRVTCNDREADPLVVPEKVFAVPAKKTAEKPKVLSYAAAAASARPARPSPVGPPTGASSSSGSRQAQLSRMVDDLVDDDDSNNPITPPQQHISTPAVMTNGEGSYHGLQDGTQDIAQLPGYGYPPKSYSKRPIAPRSPAAATSPSTLPTPKYSVPSGPTDRINSVSSFWKASPSQGMSTSPNFPTGLPTGTMTSPGQYPGRGHSRVNSGASAGSASQNIGDSWSSLEAGPRLPAANALASIGLHEGRNSFTDSGMASPLLFGAGGGLWSTGPMDAYRNVSPPNGQGG